MGDETKCTELGCMTPTQVVKCAEGSNKECWIAATMIGADGSQVTYECCGGGGQPARFSLRRRNQTWQAVSPADAPGSLSWVQRSVM
jgi:hypothetical protein